MRHLAPFTGGLRRCAPAHAAFVAGSITTIALAGLPAPTNFDLGDLYLCSQSIPGHPDLPNGGPAILRIDPDNGYSVSLLTYLPQLTSSGRIAHEPFRDVLVITASAPNGAISFVEPDGTLTELPGVNGALPAPTDDGRVYFAQYLDGAPGSVWKLAYIDVFDAVNPVLEQVGGQQFDLGSLNASNPLVNALHYHEPTNSIIVADRDPAFPFGGTFVRLFKVPLNSLGTRVGAPIVSVDYDASGGGLVPEVQQVVSLSAGPNDTVFLKVDDGVGGASGRMALLDPATMTITTYATSDYNNAGQEVAGIYIPDQDVALVLDSAGNHLRVFEQGESGAGDIVHSGDVSGLGSGETAQFAFIGPFNCPGDADGDRDTDFDDLNIVLSAFNTAPASDPRADMDDDGDCDFDDLNVILTYFGLVCD